MMEIKDAMAIWRQGYDEIHRLGRSIAAYYKVRSRISNEEQEMIKSVEDKILVLQIKSNIALDEAGLKPKRPKWIYNNEDTSTWISHKDFAFAHLV